MSPGEWSAVRVEAILPGQRDMGQPGRVDLLSQDASAPEEEQVHAKQEDGGKNGGWRRWLSWRWNS